MNAPEKAGVEIRRRIVIALIIVFLVAGMTAVTARDSGVTWDETIYFGFAAQYVSWFSNLSSASFAPETLLKVWWEVHPPLGKLWIAASLVVFGRGLDLITAARVGAGILFGLVAAAIFLWTASSRGEKTGVVAAAVFVLMPRIFAHGHFANLEMITVFFWLLTVIAFERGLTSRGWSVACGVIFGLALLCKINSVFLPILLAPWGLLLHGRKAVWNLIFMAVLGPLLFLAWPAMWVDPVLGVKEYFLNKTQRMIIPTYYLGTVYKTRFAPWHYPFVMLLATTPMPVLLFAGGTVAAYARRLLLQWRAHAHAALLMWSVALPVLLLAMPGVPKYDGIRLMLPAYPFLAILAAEGAVSAISVLRERRKRLATAAAVVLAVWLAVPVAAFHPFQLSYYGELAGGPWGAKRLGFETTYWSETFGPEALEYLNENVPQGGTVAFVAAGDFIWQTYRVTGEARPDIRLGDFDSNDWDYLVIIPRQGMLNDAHLKFMSEHQPIWSQGLPPFGTPKVCMIYRRG